ncbi:MAG: FAD-dependent oxidoreductase [Pusillimonas sp.]
MPTASCDIVEEPPRRTPVRKVVDVLVVGGGSAGLAAAVTAARLGASVLLVERNGYLGGTLTMVTLGSICGLYAVEDDQLIPVVKGFAQELIDRLASGGAAQPAVRWLETASVPYDPSLFKIIADELVVGSGVSLMFHCLAVAALREGETVRGVIFEGRDGRWACKAQVVIDCTGDGDVAALAGAAFELDAELVQAPTSMFKFGGVDVEQAASLTRPELHRCLEQAVSAGIPLPRTAGGAFNTQPGAMHLNITRVLKDGRAPNPLDTDELTYAEIEGRRQIATYLEAFRRYVPGYRDCFIADIGNQIGLRESRRIRGDYRLTLDDVQGLARFDDAIACSAWPVEEHGAGRATRWEFLPPGCYYQLPYRMLLPQGIEGLLVAGRCASASHDAHASMRVAAQCMALGEAAGTAAALAVDAGLTPRGVDAARLRRQLRAQNAFLGE